MKTLDAILVLEDGRTFKGLGFGASGEAFGEVVFNTSMTGYQEIISDPSYCGQMVTFTAPQIGNYGICKQDDQAGKPALSGIIIRELSAIPSNWRSEQDLNSWLEQQAIVCISEVDTRALTRHLRDQGAMRGGIWTRVPEGIDPLEKIRAWPSLVGRNLTGEVTAKQPYNFPAEGARSHRVALMDFGVKRGILRSLARRGIEVEVYPAGASVQDLMKNQPDGLVLSNGPGDPEPVKNGIESARALLGKLPILGICLGHQILGLSLGADTFKLRFGHHGGNHPVRDETTGEVWITAQNHGFAVKPESLPKDDVEVTHVSLYDGTLEGFHSRKHNFLAVQFHPEACPGPSDAAGIFDRYVGMLERGRSDA